MEKEQKEVVIVFKDKKSRQIKTFVNLEGHGAEMPIQDFISVLCERFGSPATTLTRAALLSKMQTSCDQVIFEMKNQTREVAGINLEPPIKKDRSQSL